MIDPGSKFHVQKLAGGSEMFSTLIGQIGDASTPHDSAMSVHIYRLGERQMDRQTPHDQDELYLVLEGRRTLHIDDTTGRVKEVPLEPMELVFVPKHCPHRFVGDDAFAALVVFAPAFTGPSART
ncbi:MAG: cupin domain-containing protein [Gammaproteobacteria bacterium]|nr:cupin domain-containing protein [Gammaproteobacteria bacterium]